MSKKRKLSFKVRQSDFYLIPNLLSISRILGVPIIIWFLFEGWALASLAIFILVGITDLVDGWIARKYKIETRLGMLLDPLADKLIILSVMIMLLWQGTLNIEWEIYQSTWIGPILVIVTVGREIAVTGLRSLASTAGITLPADQGGKIKTFIQFLAISCLLVGSTPVLETGQALLIISVIAALWSALRYFVRFIRGLPA